MLLDALLSATTSYGAKPEDTPTAIMDAMRAYIGAQGFKETGEFIWGLPRQRMEDENLRLRNALIIRQMKSLPMSDSDDLEQAWNEDSEPSPTSKIAKILATRYLESTTNSLSKVGHYGITPRTGSGVSSFLAKLL